MNICKRSLAVLTYLRSTAMLLASLAGAVGVWIVIVPVTAKVNRVFGKIESSLDLVEENLDQVEASLVRAAERLGPARQEQKQLSQQREPALKRRKLARAVQQSIAPQFEDAHAKLQTVAEAALVLNSVLEDLGNFPFLKTAGLDTERLAEMNKSLGNVAPTAWELSRLLGEPELDSDAADAELSRMERTLASLQAWLVQLKKERITQVRQRTSQLKAQVLTWIMPGAILVSGICFWVALSQVGLMFHARSWWKQSAFSKPLPA